MQLREAVEYVKSSRPSGPVNLDTADDNFNCFRSCLPFLKRDKEVNQFHGRRITSLKLKRSKLAVVLNMNVAWSVNLFLFFTGKSCSQVGGDVKVENCNYSGLADCANCSSFSSPGSTDRCHVSVIRIHDESTQ